MIFEDCDIFLLLTSQYPEIQTSAALIQLSLSSHGVHSGANRIIFLPPGSSSSMPSPPISLNCPIQPSVVGNLEPLAPNRSGLGLRGVRPCSINTNPGATQCHQAAASSSSWEGNGVQAPLRDPGFWGLSGQGQRPRMKFEVGKGAILISQHHRIIDRKEKAAILHNAGSLDPRTSGREP